MSIIIRKTARAGVCPACGSAEVEYAQGEKSYGVACTKIFQYRANFFLWYRYCNCKREFEENYQAVMTSQSITIGETTYNIPAENAKL